MSVLLAVTFGGLVAVAVAAVLFVAVASNMRNTMSLVGDKATMAIQALKLGLHTHLEPTRQAVDKFAKLYRESQFNVEDGDRMQLLLLGMLISQSDVEAVLLYDHNFVRRGVYRDEHKSIQEMPLSSYHSRRVIEQLQSIDAADAASWGELRYIERVKTVFASAAAPLMRDGKIDGYLVAAISTGRLSRVIKKLVTERGIAFILDGDGRLIAHSNSESLGLAKLRTANQPTVDPSKTTDPVLSKRRQWEPLAPLELVRTPGVVISELEVERTERRRFNPPFIILTAEISGFGPKPWTIGTYFHGNDINSEFIRLWVSAVVGLIALVISVIVAIWLARRIARPLARVSNQASRIATLDIEDVADLPPSRVREIDTTAGAFNAMLEGLRAFTVYVPRSLVAKLVQSGMADTTRSREARLTIMFSDIVGFTTLSESLSAQDTAKMLNRHFEILVACVEAEGGTVDKFLGDGMLAFWGAPDQLEDHADAAVRAALAIDQAVAIDNEKARKDGGPIIRLRIGIHTGPVIVGNIGTYDRVNYTIVGDTVNVCHRIETLGKVIAPDNEICMLASADTMNDLKSKPSHAEAGEHYLRGRAASVRLWRIHSATDRLENTGAPRIAALETASIGEPID